MIRRWAWTFEEVEVPVFPGDTIRAVNEVAELRQISHPDPGVMVQRIEVLNQRDETVQEGEFVTLLKRRGDGP